jgi:hypothetical protein
MVNHTGFQDLSGSEARCMTTWKFFITLLIMVMASACSGSGPGPSAKALPDNQQNRTIMAKKYLEAMPPKQMLHAVAARVGPRFPEKERKTFMEVMNSPEMEKAAYRINLESLVKNFTTGELQAMVAFYGSPEGKSALKKFGPYMGEVIPKIQQKVKQAIDVAQKQSGAKQSPKPQSPPVTPGKKEPKAPPAKK